MKTENEPFRADVNNHTIFGSPRSPDKCSHEI